MNSILITGGAGFIGTHTSLVLIEQGFKVAGLVVISEQDILGNRLYRQRKYNKKIKNPLQNFSEINIGDLVVHVDHGIGKYTGFKSIFADKIPMIV